MRYFVTNIFIILLAISLSYAQSGKQSIFGDVQKQIEEAKEAYAEILSPEYYAKAVENFQTAEEYYTNNKSTRDIREKLTEASNYCRRAMDAVRVGKLTLKDVIRARHDALKVEADNYAPELYKEASELFREAAIEVEDGDLDDAREKGSEAEQLFRQSELKSIKDKILNDARTSIAEAGEIDAEDHCPQTYMLSKGLLDEVENLLRNNRYAAEDANTKAIETAYQGRHAIHLTHEIAALKEDDKNWEKLILSFESMMTEIGEKFDEKLRYDSGFKESLNTIVTRISQMQDENQRLITENETLQEELQLYKEQATTSTAELEIKQQLEAKIDKIKAMYSLSEAKVIYDGDNLIIRLIGLNFQSGKSIIMPEYFALLRKVKESIVEFPESHILLEGHTDSRGNPSTNKRLSEERAKAIREYIVANMEIDRAQISAIGYGDTKPVASNKTSEGRELNRRIDVVISLTN